MKANRPFETVLMFGFEAWTWKEFLETLLFFILIYTMANKSDGCYSLRLQISHYIGVRLMWR
jgi:hypothetical protein